MLRLIDEAAADGRTTLDLAGEGLSELPPEIGKLTNLKTLVLGRWDKKKGKSLGNNLKTLPKFAKTADASPTKTYKKSGATPNIQTCAANSSP